MSDEAGDNGNATGELTVDEPASRSISQFEGDGFIDSQTATWPSGRPTSLVKQNPEPTRM